MPTGGAYIAPEACEAIWRIVTDAIRRGTRDGGSVRADVRDAAQALRGAAQSHLIHMSATGHERAKKADTTTKSIVSDLVSTQALADRLGVTARHARRLAARADIEPVGRGQWRREDMNRLATARRQR